MRVQCRTRWTADTASPECGVDWTPVSKRPALECQAPPACHFSVRSLSVSAACTSCSARAPPFLWIPTSGTWWTAPPPHNRFAGTTAPQLATMAAAVAGRTTAAAARAALSLPGAAAASRVLLIFHPRRASAGQGPSQATEQQRRCSRIPQVSGYIFPGVVCCKPACTVFFEPLCLAGAAESE